MQLDLKLVNAVFKRGNLEFGTFFEMVKASDLVIEMLHLLVLIVLVGLF